jgi:glucosamine--fructose-6-phosphate aminotransferase (isomerizing)
MCGIVGYVGDRAAEPLLLEGLRRLEYRGYDSAGIALQGETSIESVRAVGNLDALAERLARRRERLPERGGLALVARPATAGIGHTRWATHGRVSERNAHPHVDDAGRVHVVVNGIVENYLALKERLIAAGATFASETDAEVIAHLIAAHLADGSLAEAVRQAYAELEGHFAFVAMSAEDPETLVAARRECPLIVGRGDGEQFVASAVPAFVAHTRDVQFVETDDIVILRPNLVLMMRPDGTPVDRDVVRVEWDDEIAETGGHETFMLKELHEQPVALADTIAATAGLPGLDPRLLAGARRIVVVACGTSYHAGLIGRYAIEGWARVPVEVEIASEYRYRDPIVGPGDLVVGITQSGETADTLAAMRLARARGATVLAVTNVQGSQATRDADAVLFTRAGLEIGVAATKTFTCQVAVMLLLGLRLAELHKTLPPSKLAALVDEVRRLPVHAARLLDTVEPAVAALAEHWWQAEFFLFLGRHSGLPVALEGALKLKEISYIATDAYAAGEMKHGPIALLDEMTPVVCVATDSPVLDKLASNMQEVRARGAHVIAITTEGNEEIAGHAESTLAIPRTDWTLQPILAVIPLQLLAYGIARRRGLNVDQPRNLAKTVTVE